MDRVFKKFQAQLEQELLIKAHEVLEETIDAINLLKNQHAALNSAKASIEIEGFSLKEEQIELVRKKISGDITHEKFIERAIEIAKTTKN